VSFQQTLDAFRADFEAGGPPYYADRWVHDLFHRARDELVASAAADRALKAGDRIPTFTLVDGQGAQVSSRALLHKGPLVISFYRGHWCPFCSIELQALEASLPEIRRRDSSLIAISPQTRANSRLCVDQNRLTFPVLSDPRNRVSAQFGLRFKLPDYVIDVYERVFRANLAIINAGDRSTLPMPARFVVAQDGTIIYAEVNPDFTCRPNPEDLLPALTRAQELSRT
jgi:peroxiredoxin